MLLRTKSILERKIVANIIPKLKENQTLSNWVNEGRNLHIKEQKCQFCGNELPKDLLEILESHFSDDFERLQQYQRGSPFYP